MDDAHEPDPPLNRVDLADQRFLSATGIPRLDVVDSTGSTNADLLRAVTVEPGLGRIFRS